jgi:hypothetical protein
MEGPRGLRLRLSQPWSKNGRARPVEAMVLVETPTREHALRRLKYTRLRDEFHRPGDSAFAQLAPSHN